VLDKLIRALAAESWLSPEEIMDVLWLSATRPVSAEHAPSADAEGTSGAADAENEPEQAAAEESVGDGGPVADGPSAGQVPLRLDGGAAADGERVPAIEVGFGAPPPLHDPLRLVQALRSLKAVRAPGPRPEVDIDATVEATADARRLTIVTTRPLQRVLDLAIVVDGAPAMRIWGETFDQFERVLLQTGAFRTVSRWRLITAADGEAQLVDRRNVRQPARRLVDPSGRRIVLIATDATAPNWYAGSVWAAIAAWGKSMPTAIVQVLPPHYWPSTAIGEPYLTVRSPTPAGPNAAYARRVDWWATDPGGDPVPVLALAAATFVDWTRAAVTGTDWVDAISAIPPDPEHAPAVTDTDDPVTLVNDFLVLASDGAERLARALSGAATLTMPLISLLQEEMAKGTGVTELAEILASGLLVDVAATSVSPGTGTRDEHQPVLRFRPGVREILQRGATAFDEWAMYAAVSRYLAERGRPGGPLRALIPDPDGPAELNLAIDPFASLEQSLAVRLGLRPAPAPAELPEVTAPQAAPLEEYEESEEPGPDYAESSVSTDSAEAESPSDTPREPRSSSLPDEVHALVVAPDGRWLASGHADGTVRIWDPATGRLIVRLVGHLYPVRALAASPDEPLLVSGDSQGMLMLWDPDTGELRNRLQAHSAAITAVAAGVSSDGPWVLSGSEHGTLRLWDAVTLQQQNMVNLRSGPVNALAVVPDTSCVVSGTADGTLTIQELPTLRLRATWQESAAVNAAAVNAVAASPDGSWVASGRADGIVALHETPTLRPRTNWPHVGGVNAVAVAPDGRWVLSAAANGSLLLKDQTVKQVPPAWRHPGGVNAVAASPHGLWVASGGGDGTVRLWDPTGHRQLVAMGLLAKVVPTEGSAAPTLEPKETASLLNPVRESAALIEIAIGPGDSPGQFRVTAVDSAMRRASAVMRLDAGDSLNRGRRTAAQVLASMGSRGSPEGESSLRELGQALFTALLGDEQVRSVYRGSAANAARRQEELRIALRIDVPELAELPWECMYDDTEGAYICRLHLVTRVLGVAAPSPVVRPPLRMLAVISAPRDFPSLDAEKERDQVMSALARPVNDGLIDVTWSAEATWAGLQETLLDGPWHVIHFIGHGGFDPTSTETFLVLTEPDGRSAPVEISRFADLLRQGRPTPRLVVLNTNNSALGAVALVRSGIPAVVGLQYEISDDAAIAFSRGFYAALARGRALDQAVSGGRVGILGLRHRSLEWAAPVLYTRGGDRYELVTPPNR
jgi:WD40 repeat protein